MRRYFLHRSVRCILLAFISAFMTSPSHAVQKELPQKPGWHEIENSKLRAVCPAKGFGGIDYNFRFYCKNVTGAWSGGALDSKRNSLYMWGGGHNDYYGNEIYALELDTLSTTRLTTPAIPIANRRDSSKIWGELSPFDGTQPNSRHTYDGIAYLPHVDKMWAFSGSLATSGGRADNLTWIFDPAKKTWQKMHPKGDIPKGALSIVSAYDPVTKKIFLHNRLEGLFSYEYAPDGGTYTQLSRDGRLGVAANAVIDPKRRNLIILGRGNESIYDIGPGSLYIQQNLQSKDDKEIVAHQAPGLAYDPVSDKIIGWAGGNKLYSLNLDTLSWSSQDYPNGPTSQHRQGTYGRWAYVSSLDVFILYNKVDENGYIFRPIRKDSITTGTPTAPQNLHVTKAYPFKIELSWQVSDDELGIFDYQIFRDGTLLTTTQQNSFADLFVTEGEVHLYTVRARSFSSATSSSSTLTVKVPTSTAVKALGDCSVEHLISGRQDIVFCEPWNQEDWWKNDYLGDPILADPRRVKKKSMRNAHITSENCVSGSCLEVFMKKGQSGALNVHWPLSNAGLAPEQIFLRYYLRLGPNWNPNMCNKDGSYYGQGGKFPGIADVRTWADPQGQCGNGGKRSDGINCWSMRGGFRTCKSGKRMSCRDKPNAISRFKSYIYHPGQKGRTGDAGMWDSDNYRQSFRDGTCTTTPNNMYCGIGEGGVLVPNRWYQIEMQVSMNTPGQQNGIIRGWVDGVLSYEKKNMVFRLPGHDNLHNRLIWLNIYKGGTKGNCNNSKVYLDQMVIATDAPVGGLESETSLPPNIQLDASSTWVKSGDATILNWHVSGADSCRATGDWSGFKPFSGSEPIGPIMTDQTYTITCTYRQVSHSQSIQVYVKSNINDPPSKTEKLQIQLSQKTKRLKLKATQNKQKSLQITTKMRPQTRTNAWKLSAQILQNSNIRLSWTDMKTSDNDRYIIFDNHQEIGRTKTNSFPHKISTPRSIHQYRIGIIRSKNKKMESSPSLNITIAEQAKSSTDQTNTITLLSPIADTHLDSSTYRGLGNKTRLDVSIEQKILLKFNIPKLNAKQEIRSAYLRLYDYAEYGTLDLVGVYRAEQNWQEGATREFYNPSKKNQWKNYLGDWRDSKNQPQGDIPYAEKRLADDDKPQWVEWNITSLVRQWSNKEYLNHGLLIRNRHGGDTHIFRSREFTDPEFRPQLIIVTTGVKH